MATLVTVVVPTGNAAPGGGVLNTVTSEAASTASPASGVTAVTDLGVPS